MFFLILVVMKFGSVYSIENGTETDIHVLKAFQINRNDFTVSQTLSLAGTSSAGCGTHFVSLKRGEPLSKLNGFHIDASTRQCQLGRISLSVEEIGEDTIKVFGLGKSHLSGNIKVIQVYFF